jgi:hypothetical protein
MATYLPNDPARVAMLDRYARAAGVAMLLSIVFGILGELYLPGKIIVRGDAAATAANIVGNPTLFRLTFASYLVEAICDVALLVLFYVILKPVNRNIALLSAFFGIVSMVTFAVAQSSFFASSVILSDRGGLTEFTAAQRANLAYLAVRISAMIAALFLCMYGIASILRGYLIMRSGYIPRVLGILLMIGGAGFFLRSTTYILAPSFSSPIMLLPMAAAGIPLMLWLLFRGIGDRRLAADPRQARL